MVSRVSRMVGEKGSAVEVVEIRVPLADIQSKNWDVFCAELEGEAISEDQKRSKFYDKFTEAETLVQKYVMAEVGGEECRRLCGENNGNNNGGVWLAKTNATKETTKPREIVIKAPTNGKHELAWLEAILSEQGPQRFREIMAIPALYWPTKIVLVYALEEGKEGSESHGHRRERWFQVAAKAKGVSLEEMGVTLDQILTHDPAKQGLYRKFLEWYNGWTAQVGVRHCDINAGNIFYEEETQTYSLIDCMGVVGVEVVPPNIKYFQLNARSFTRTVVPPTHVHGISLSDVKADADDFLAGLDLD